MDPAGPDGGGETIGSLNDETAVVPPAKEGTVRKRSRGMQRGANSERNGMRLDRGPCLEPLESRLFLSADAVGSDAAAPVDAPTDSNAVVMETTEYAGGTGSESDPFQIATAEALQHLCAAPAEWSLHFVLLEDVDLEGAELTPIGEEATPFTGVFDGQGHVIRNGFIDQVDNPYVGLFGWVGETGVVCRLGVEDVPVSGSLDLRDYTYVGGLVAHNRGTIADCYATGPVDGQYVVGGLVSLNDGTIENCHATGAVGGARHIGGLVGLSYGTITGCHAAGPISGARYVGGLAGTNIEGVIADCYATGAVNGSLNVGGLVGSCSGAVSNCYASGDVAGEDFVGGLFGGSSAVTTCCYATGAVRGNWAIGGLMGSSGGVVSDCYARGAVDGTSFVAGLMGACSGTAMNCYSTGLVSGFSDVGGLVAENTGAIVNCFWDVQTSGQATSAAGVGKTTAEMQQQTTFTDVGWDFDDIWWMPEADYPALVWQLSQNLLPDTPVGQSPANGAAGVSLTPTLAASAFVDLDLEDGHAATRWQIDDSEDFLSPIWDHQDIDSDKTAEAVPSGVLTYNGTYHWRVRYQDSKGAWSRWSEPMQFATVTAPYVCVAVSPSSVGEDGPTNLVYTFTRSTTGSGSLTVNFTVGGTATCGVDYTAKGAARFTATEGTVRIPSGRSSVTVTIDPTADASLEHDETVILTVRPGVGYSVGTPGAATGTVLTDEEATWLDPADAHGIRNIGGETLLLDFLSVMNGTEDRTVLEFDIRALGGTPWLAMLHLYVGNLDDEPPDGVIDVYAFNGDGIVTIDEFWAGGPTPAASVVCGQGLVTVDVTSAVRASAAAGAEFVGFRLSTQTGDRYGLGSISGQPEPVLAVAVTSPDLSWCRLSGTSSKVAAGDSLKMSRSYRVSTLPAEADFAIEYRLSTNQIWGDADDVILAPQESITALADKAVGLHGGTFAVAVPESTRPGSYYLLAKLDSGSAVRESNETDNVKVGNVIRVLAKPGITPWPWPASSATAKIKLRL